MALKENINFFGETNYRNQRHKFGIKTDDRRRHMYVIGKTGMGKSNMLENMVYSDIHNGHGVCYIDPHGDTAEKIINFIPSHRINDVVYFNPADMNYPLAFNVLESVDPAYKHLVASGLIGVFKKIWADSWGPRLEYILRNCFLALLDHPDSTLLGVTRMLVDKEFRKKVVKNVKDPVVKSFWVDEFTKFNDRTIAEVISPIQNKVGQFLSTALIRNIVGQVKSTIRMREIMDEKKILIMNLSKGRIGEDASSLLGAMIVTKIQLAAMSRVDIPEDSRADFYLYVDEFQNFATDSFASILSEARKYHLNLIIAHQYIRQIDETVANAVFGNVGTLVTFRVGAADAEELVKEFSPFFTEEDIVNLPKFHIYLKLMIDGVASNPFSACALPPLSAPENNEEKIIKVSRERYAKSREVVEDKIMRWSGLKMDDDDAGTASQKEPEPIPIRHIAESGHPVNFIEAMKLDINTKKLEHRTLPDTNDSGGSKHSHNSGKFPYTCNRCGKEFRLNFELDKSKPIYCKDCLTAIKEEKEEAKNRPPEKKSHSKRDIPLPPDTDRKDNERSISLKDLQKQSASGKSGRDLVLKSLLNKSGNATSVSAERQKDAGGSKASSTNQQNRSNHGTNERKESRENVRDSRGVKSQRNERKPSRQEDRDRHSSRPDKKRKQYEQDNSEKNRADKQHRDTRLNRPARNNTQSVKPGDKISL